MHSTKAGLKPILLFGGATGSIGDPGGKNSERQLLSLEETDANLKTHISQVKKLWSNGGITSEPTFVNNLDWTKEVSFLSFLRDIGKHFTVNYMMAKDW